MPEPHTSERKQTFIKHLPARLASIEADWNRLSSGRWKSEVASQLLETVQILAGSSSRHSLLDLCEHCVSMERLLAEAIHKKNGFTDSGKRSVIRLIRSLYQEIGLLNRQFALKPAHQGTIYLLESAEALRPGLASLLLQQGYQVTRIANSERLESELQQRLPDAVVLDEGAISRMASINRELEVQQSLHRKPVKLLCLSRSGDLEKRLLAQRSGIHAFLALPVGHWEILSKLNQLVSTDTEPHRILIIEGDATRAEHLASMLNRESIITHILKAPLKAFQVIDQFCPDLIMMSRTLPDIDGIELIRLIREQPANALIPILFTSGEEDAETQIQALGAGADEYLHQPIQPPYLINTVQNRIQRARLAGLQRPLPCVRDRETGLHTQRHFYRQLEAVTTGYANGLNRGAILYLTLAPSPAQPSAGFLVCLGSLIAEQLEPQDRASRINDSEFVILLLRPHIKGILSQAREIVFDITRIPGGERANPRIGISPLDDPAMNNTGAIEHAAAISRSLQSGSDQVAIYQRQAKTQRALDKSALKQMVEEALNTESLQLLFSPLHPLNKNDHTFHEAKLRMLLPNRQVMGNSDLFTLCNEIGVGREVSLWSTRQVLQTLDQKRREGKKVSLLVSQSTETVFLNRQIDSIREQLRAIQLVGSGLVLEFRVTELSRDLKAARAYFEHLKAMDIRISLSRFSATPATCKVLDYLRPDYVRLAGPALQLADEEARSLQHLFKQVGVQIILPDVRDNLRISEIWYQLADFSSSPKINPQLEHQSAV